MKKFSFVKSVNAKSGQEFQLIALPKRNELTQYQLLVNAKIVFVGDNRALLDFLASH